MLPPQLRTKPVRELLEGQVQPVVKAHAVVGELAKGALLLLLYFRHLVGSSAKVRELKF